MKSMKNKNTNKKRGLIWLFSFAVIAIASVVSCRLLFVEKTDANKTFADNTTINGIDVGHMSMAEAENAVLTGMLEDKKDIEIELVCNENIWKLDGGDFEACNRLTDKISKIAKGENNKKIDAESKNFTISYANILSNLHEKLDEIAVDVEQDAKPASLIFNPNNEDVFDVDMGQNKIVVDRKELYKRVERELALGKKIKVEIPTIETQNMIDVEALKNSVGLRSSYTTNYQKSSADRKNNIKNALKNFNGMIVQPGQSVSFNQTTGERTTNNGYSKAHILVGGNYVDGVGGGVCQASTTLYNALLLADVDVISVSHHTIPASYVPLSFDAMVSGDYADLVFQNNLDGPIYIRTHADDQNVCVEIYGQKLDEGVEIKHKAEFIKILPHNGDKIVADSKGEYSNKILYKGEYYRARFPREGYESKAYLQYYKDGELISEKEIRHDYYPAQDGLVFEGVEDAVEGMTIPASDVKIIRPQKISQQTEENVRKKLEKTNPEEYNP